ncbi:MAG: tetratricopeptide repeat protein [Oscillospiraceae bacterium]|nr:tetratricopeptide repeat protein [Oscillospiraceae bacterium]
MTGTFDSADFYKRLDEMYTTYDNEEIEQFLLTSLDNIENAAIIDGCCCNCLGAGCVDEEAQKQEELRWAINRSHGIIVVLNELACFYRGVSRWEECLSTFERVKTAMEEASLTSTDNYAVVILNMAGALRLLNQREKARAYFEKAEAILTKNGTADPYTMGSLYNNVGLVYQDEKQFSAAAEYFGKALEYTAKIADSAAEVATGLGNVALAYFSAGDMENANEAIDRSIAIFTDLDEGLNPHYAGTLNTKAFICYNTGKLEEAVENFELAAEKTEKIFGKNIDYVKACRNCGVVFDKLGEKQKAEKYRQLADSAEKELK